MINKTTRKIALVGMLLTAVPAIWAATITLEPSKDNSIFEEADESNGAGTFLFSGQTAGRNTPLPNALRRALLQFDLTGLIPDNSIIESVSLTLNANKVFTSSSQTMTLHRLTSDWGEGASNAIGQEGKGTAAQSGDATWRHTFYSSQFWAALGGDYLPSPSASQGVGGGTTSSPVAYTWAGSGMVDDVNAWLDNPTSNFGWILVGLETETSAKRFYSRETTTQNLRPQLSITYTEGAPTTWAGYAIDEDGRTVDTGSFLGVIDIATKPWIWVYDLENYIYLPEEYVSEEGAWGHVAN